MAYEDPLWNRASDWLSGLQSHEEPQLHVVGLPVNRSVTPGSCDLAPEAIREILVRFSTFSFTVPTDLRLLPVRDCGDTLDLAILRETLSKTPSVLLGGDNGVTRMGVGALSAAMNVGLNQIGVITLDAHLDLRHLDDGPMNGNPIRGLIEDGLPGSNIVQIGLQSFANSPAYARDGLGFGIRQITVEECWNRDFGKLFSSELERLAHSCSHIYFDLDLDVMDRAFAPGCPGSRPGGLMPHHLRLAARIAGAHPRVRVMDLVELDPTTDSHSATTMTAAACLLEFAAGVLSSQ